MDTDKFYKKKKKKTTKNEKSLDRFPLLPQVDFYPYNLSIIT